MWFQVELPKPETVTEIQFQSPAPGGRGGAGNAAAALASGGAPVGGPPGFPRGYKVEISTDGASWNAASPRAPATASTTISHVPAGPGEVRPHQPDVERRRRAGVVDPESQNLRPHEA